MESSTVTSELRTSLTGRSSVGRRKKRFFSGQPGGSVLWVPVVPCVVAGSWAQTVPRGPPVPIDSPAASRKAIASGLFHQQRPFPFLPDNFPEFLGRNNYPMTFNQLAKFVERHFQGRRSFGVGQGGGAGRCLTHTHAGSQDQRGGVGTPITAEEAAGHNNVPALLRNQSPQRNGCHYPF